MVVKEVVEETKKPVKKKKKVVGVEKNKYELVAVYPLSVNEIVAEKDLGEKCTKAGFEIVEVDKWGVKILAYKIKKEVKGYYLRFIITEGNAAKLENSLRIDDNLLRFLIIRI